MRSLILLLALSPLTSIATQSPLVATWHLDKWVVRNGQGTTAEFCKGANGFLIYEKSGYVSTAINCPTKRTPQREPADDYQRKFFYAGTYRVKGGVIYKLVANASAEALIGKTVLRKIEKITANELILTGPFGPDGGTLWIRWTK
jgi:hypothetical protein